MGGHLLLQPVFLRCLDVRPVLLPFVQQFLLFLEEGLLGSVGHFDAAQFQPQVEQGMRYFSSTASASALNFFVRLAFQGLPFLAEPILLHGPSFGYLGLPGSSRLELSSPCLLHFLHPAQDLQLLLAVFSCRSWIIKAQLLFLALPLLYRGCCLTSSSQFTHSKWGGACFLNPPMVKLQPVRSSSPVSSMQSHLPMIHSPPS